MHKEGGGGVGERWEDGEGEREGWREGGGERKTESIVQREKEQERESDQKEDKTNTVLHKETHYTTRTKGPRAGSQGKGGRVKRQVNKW